MSKYLIKKHTTGCFIVEKVVFNFFGAFLTNFIAASETLESARELVDRLKANEDLSDIVEIR